MLKKLLFIVVTLCFAAQTYADDSYIGIDRAQKEEALKQNRSQYLIEFGKLTELKKELKKEKEKLNLAFEYVNSKANYKELKITAKRSLTSESLMGSGVAVVFYGLFSKRYTLYKTAAGAALIVGGAILFSLDEKEVPSYCRSQRASPPRQV